MIARIKLLVQIIGWSFRLRPVATTFLIIFMAVDAVSATVMAVVQGYLIQHAPAGLGAGVVVSIATAALITAMIIVSYRVLRTLQRDIAEGVELILMDDLVRWSTRPATVEHLQDPVFLDKLSVIVRRSGGLGHAAWSGLLLVSSAASVIVSLVVLARISPWLIMLALLSVPPILLAGRSGDLYMQAIDKNSELLRLDEQLTSVTTSAGTLKELVVSGSAPEVDTRARALWDEMADHEWRARGLAVILTSLGWLIYGVGAAGALAWTIFEARAGRASIGDVGVVAGLAVFLAQQIMHVLSFRVQIADSGRVADHYVWIRDRTATAPEPVASLRQITAGLELRSVGYRYPGSTSASLDGVDLVVPAGTVLGVVGVNGAGKSTLAKIITGLLTPTQGEVLVDGQRVEPGALGGGTSGTFQDYAQLELRAYEAVGIADLDRARQEPELDRAAVAGGSDAVIARLGERWQSQLGATFDGEQLSAGQWQRLALSRGLFKADPVVLVLDEPTAALDPQSEHDLFVAFAAHARALAAINGAITVLVSHRFSTVTMTDLIVVLDEGRVVEQGSHVELMAAEGVYRRLFDAQAKGYR